MRQSNHPSTPYIVGINTDVQEMEAEIFPDREVYWRMLRFAIRNYATGLELFVPAKRNQDFGEIPFILESVFYGIRKAREYFIRSRFALDWCARNNITFHEKYKRVKFPKSILTSPEMFGLVESLAQNEQIEVAPVPDIAAEEIPIPPGPPNRPDIRPKAVDWKLVEELVNSCDTNWWDESKAPLRWVNDMKRRDNIKFVATCMTNTKFVTRGNRRVYSLDGGPFMLLVYLLDRHRGVYYRGSKQTKSYQSAALDTAPITKRQLKYLKASHQVNAVRQKQVKECDVITADLKLTPRNLSTSILNRLSTTARSDAVQTIATKCTTRKERRDHQALVLMDVLLTCFSAALAKYKYKQKKRRIKTAKGVLPTTDLVSSIALLSRIQPEFGKALILAVTAGNLFTLALELERLRVDGFISHRQLNLILRACQAAGYAMPGERLLKHIRSAIYDLYFTEFGVVTEAGTERRWSNLVYCNVSLALSQLTAAAP
jgi:hypothetical protein